MDVTASGFVPPPRHSARRGGPQPVGGAAPSPARRWDLLDFAEQRSAGSSPSGGQRWTRSRKAVRRVRTDGARRVRGARAPAPCRRDRPHCRSECARSDPLVGDAAAPPPFPSPARALWRLRHPDPRSGGGGGDRRPAVPDVGARRASAARRASLAARFRPHLDASPLVAVSRHSSSAPSFRWNSACP